MQVPHCRSTHSKRARHGFPCTANADQPGDRRPAPVDDREVVRARRSSLRHVRIVRLRADLHGALRSRRRHADPSARAPRPMPPEPRHEPGVRGGSAGRVALRDLVVLTRHCASKERERRNGVLGRVRPRGAHRRMLGKRRNEDRSGKRARGRRSGGNLLGTRTRSRLLTTRARRSRMSSPRGGAPRHVQSERLRPAMPGPRGLPVPGSEDLRAERCRR